MKFVKLLKKETSALLALALAFVVFLAECANTSEKKGDNVFSSLGHLYLTPDIKPYKALITTF